MSEESNVEREQTDLQKFLSLYRSFGIKLEARPRRIGAYQRTLKSYVVDMGEEHGFKGYAGFGSWVIFDKDGNFVSQSFGEG